MQALRNGRALATLLLAGGLALLAAGAGYAQDASDAATSDAGAQVDAETSRTADDGTARSANQSCLNRFGPDLFGPSTATRTTSPWTPTTWT